MTYFIILVKVPRDKVEKCVRSVQQRVYCPEATDKEIMESISDFSGATKEHPCSRVFKIKIKIKKTF